MRRPGEQCDSPRAILAVGGVRDNVPTMAAALLFKDLFTYDRRSIAWLRIFRLETGEGVAVVVEPDDNPGASSVNAAESLLRDLRRAFPGLQPLRVFVNFPHDPRGPGWTELSDSDDGIVFKRRPVGALMTLVGVSPVAGGEVDEATCAFFGGEQHPLLGLIPPPDLPRERLRDLCVIAVADLPWPHNPSGCKWSKRFERVEALYSSSGHPDPAVGAQWFLTLTDDELAACSYHRADWLRIAEVSVGVFRSLANDATLEDAVAAVEAELGESAEGRWCSSLFLDPIVCRPKGRSVTNGQHRACALRASGAPVCVVDVGDEYVGEPRPADPWRRAAGDIAAFWAKYAGS